MARTRLMPDQFLHLPTDARREILQTAATTLGRSASVLEKDIWVCWALQALFSIPNAHSMAFKGGTSLSKIYNVISRFSEDVDVTIDYKSFGENFDPFGADVSRSAIGRFSDRLKEHVKKYANDIVVPHIGNQLDEFSQQGGCGIKISENGEKIWIQYPSAIETSDDYMSNDILIELGGRNVIEPNEKHVVSAEIIECDIDLEFPSGSVDVLSLERTFWEKVTLIHVECNRKKAKADVNRQSRHWYDLKMLYKHAAGESAISNRSLLEDVVAHKKVFFHTGYANYDNCLRKEFKLAPDGELLSNLETDYKGMLSAGMIYDNPPSFEEIMNDVHEIEKILNT